MRYAEVLQHVAVTLSTMRVEYESFRKVMIVHAHDTASRETYADRRGLAALSVLSKGGGSAHGKKP